VLVTACCHGPVMPQPCDQAARALRPCTHTRDQKEFTGVGREQLSKDQVLVLRDGAAVLGLFSPTALEVHLKLWRESWRKDLGQTCGCSVLYFL